MSDLKLEIKDDGEIDLAVSETDIETDAGLQSAIMISLFTDKRASVDELPAGETDQRGYWGDALEEDGSSLGSKLWLLDRSKITNKELDRAKAYCEEALKWLIDEKIASSVTVTVERRGDKRFIVVEVARKNGTDAKFSYVWNNV